MLRQGLTRDGKDTASVQVACPSCEAESMTRIDAPHGPAAMDSAGAWTCPHCHTAPETSGPRPVKGEPISRCWICGAEEFYIQKDFNRQLGFFIVAAVAGCIFLFMLITQEHLLGVGLLLGVAFVDWIAFRLIRNVTVCYLCHSLYRGFPQHGDHTGFYLGSEEKYKKLRKKWLEESV